MDAEQNGLVEDIARQRNRALFGYGAGTLATVLTTVTSATVSLTNPGGVSGTVNPLRFIPSAAEVASGNVTVADYTGTTLNFVDTVASISTSAGTITTTSSHTWTAADVITFGAINGSVSEGSLNLEPVGLLGIVDQTTYLTTIFGLNRSTAANAFFLSQVFTSTGTLSDDLVYRNVDNTEEVSGEVIDCIYTHNSVRREFIKLSQADRRYMGADLMKPDTGTQAGVFKTDLTWSGIPIKVEKDAPYGTIFGVNRAHLFWIPEVEGEWADEDGAILLRSATADAYEGRFRVFENFFSDKGDAHFRMDGVTATVTPGIYSA